MNNNEVASTRDTVRTFEVLEQVESYATSIQEALSLLESAIGPITDRLMDLHSKLIAIKEKINDLTDSVTL